MCRRDKVFKPWYPAKPVLLESGFALNLLIPRDCIFGPGNSDSPVVATRENYSSARRSSQRREKPRGQSRNSKVIPSLMLLLYGCFLRESVTKNDDDEDMDGGPGTLSGHFLNTLRTLSRHSSDTIWTFDRHSPDTLWKLIGHSLDIRRTLVRRQQPDVKDFLRTWTQ
ncbi:hypothetical protein QTP88_006382 [Uroleucon formosanum]